MSRRARSTIVLTLVATVVGAVVATGVLAFSPAREAGNYSKIGERQRVYSTPAYQTRLSQVGAQHQAEGMREAAADPERNFLTTLCWSHQNGCAGDVRLYDWQRGGHGLVRPVLFTARDGATLSGHVWATRSGPRRRPGIVITPGSVQAPEQLYWFAAQALAKDGYVVMTYDVQGQGRSDVFGEGVDHHEGFPAQSTGTPFFDGTQDALNFLLSTPAHPYVPARSRSTHTSHAAKQDRRVREGRGAASNPFWRTLDRRRIGLAGHSYGAQGVSYVGQQDRRVGAVVAWDNLCVPTQPPATYQSAGSSGGASSGTSRNCLTGGSPRAPRLSKPSLGISADYFLTPTPYTSDPDPLDKSRASLAYTRRHVDTGQIVIRGGTHYEFSFLPNALFGATLRGIDLVTWYTSAWFDRYLKRDCTADRRLLTDRWRHEPAEAAVDPAHDGDMLSYHYRSRLDFHRRDGRRYDGEDLRSRPHGLTRRDGYRGSYGYLPIATSADRSSTRFGACAARRHRAPARPRFTG